MAGVVAGAVLGKQAHLLGEVSGAYIRLLKFLATPLIFFAIIDAFSKTQIQARSGLRLITISLLNAGAAAVIAICISLFFSDGPTREMNQVASTLADPLGRGSATRVPAQAPGGFPITLLVIVAAIGLGALFRRFHRTDQHQKVRKVFEQAYYFFTRVLHGVLLGIPLAIFCIIAKLVGVSGFGFLSTLLYFVFMISIGIMVHLFLYYPLLLFLAGVPPVMFYRHAAGALITALSTGSSLASLPVTLKTLREKMKVSVESSSLAACVGTNLNHDGIFLYEAMTCMFVAKVYGISLTFGQKVTVLGSSALAAIGIAGVPDAGLLTLSVVLSASGLPLTLIPLFTTVDWWLGRLRATANVTSDLVVANLLDRWKDAGKEQSL